MVPCGRTHETKPDGNWLHKYLWILLQCQTSTYLFVVRRMYIHTQSNLLDLHPPANHILFVVINEFDKKWISWDLLGPLHKYHNIVKHTNIWYYTWAHRLPMEEAVCPAVNDDIVIPSFHHDFCHNYHYHLLVHSNAQDVDTQPPWPQRSRITLFSAKIPLVHVASC